MFQVQYNLEILDPNLSLEHLRTEVNDPNNRLVTSEIKLNNDKGVGQFTPIEPGLHQVIIYHLL